MWLYLLATTLGCVHGQYVKTASYSGVKGGQGNHQYNAGDNLANYYGNNTQQQGYGQGGQNYGSSSQSQVGICYIEVPTASLFRDPAHVPAGNGSRPDLSRIRSCCNGYIRNIHNYQICDPVCTKECVNALCTAPETCTCFYDHVKNSAGYCIPTCPIGCQNGNCAGGECICKDGFRLDSESKYCLPICKNGCGSEGNCTAPNTCSCKTGYESTPEGSCRPACNKPCTNGDCIAPNNCQCQPGYTKNPEGECAPHCSHDCGPSGRCVSPNVCSNQMTSLPGYQPNHGYNPATNSSVPPNSYNNQNYPSNYPQYPTNFNYSSNHPQSPENQRPYNSNYPSQPNYPGGQRPIYSDNNTSYYSTDSYYRSSYNMTSDSQVHRPDYPNNPNNQLPYNSGSGYPNPSGQPSSGNLLNLTDRYPPGSYQPYNPSGLNSSNPNQFPTNHPYYPYYPDHPTGPPSNPNQQGYYPGQPNQPGSYQNQPGYNSNQPHQPGYNPNQPGYSPNQPGYNPNQPNQPGHSPNQPGYNPYQPYQPGYNPNQPGQSNSYNNSNPYQPLYPTIQLPNNPYDQTNSQGLIPQCSQPCTNGICVEGNRCSCNPGYILDTEDPTGTRCVPHCPGGCVNGVCSAPNFCICNMGYRKEQGVKGGSARCVKRIRRAARLLTLSTDP